MFVIRESFREDIDQIHEVARHLDTVNLPNDRGMLEKILDLSARSFSGEVPVFEREYLDALIKLHGGKVSQAATAADMDRVYLYRLLRRHRLRT